MNYEPTPQALWLVCWGFVHVLLQSQQCQFGLLPWRSLPLFWSNRSWHHPAVQLAVHTPATKKQDRWTDARKPEHLEMSLTLHQSTASKNIIITVDGTVLHLTRFLIIFSWLQKVFSYSERWLIKGSARVKKKRCVNCTVLLSVSIFIRSSVFCNSSSAMAIWSSTIFRSSSKSKTRFCWDQFALRLTFYWLVWLLHKCT